MKVIVISPPFSYYVLYLTRTVKHSIIIKLHHHQTLSSLTLKSEAPPVKNLHDACSLCHVVLDFLRDQSLVTGRRSPHLPDCLLPLPSAMPLGAQNSSSSFTSHWAIHFWSSSSLTDN